MYVIHYAPQTVTAEALRDAVLILSEQILALAGRADQALAADFRIQAEGFSVLRKD